MVHRPATRRGRHRRADRGRLARPTSPCRSTAPPAPSRWGSRCAGGTATTGAPSRPTRTSTSPTPTRVSSAARSWPHEIQRPRTGPMRDIVATIQPEQDAVVRADLGVTVCVQGAPGTGKTAVGLHRVAFLLYAHRERLRRSGVLFVGPNRSFLSYIGQVLPALGEYDVAQTTVDDLTQRAARSPHRPARGGAAQGRRPAGGGRTACRLVSGPAPDRGARRPGGLAPLAGVRGPGGRRHRLPAGTRRAVRLRPSPASLSASPTRSSSRWSAKG